jgi:hypothetical protein
MKTLKEQLIEREAQGIRKGTALAYLLSSPEIGEENKEELRKLELSEDEKSACFRWLWTTHDYDSIKKLRELTGYELSKSNIVYKMNSTSIADEYCRNLDMGYKKEAKHIEECTGIRNLCSNIANIGLSRSINGLNEKSLLNKLENDEEKELLLDIKAKITYGLRVLYYSCPECYKQVMLQDSEEFDLGQIKSIVSKSRECYTGYPALVVQ